MSIASYNQFQQAVMQDSALQEQFKAVAATSPESLGELVVKLGAERGYNFTLEDIQAAVEAAASSPSAGEVLKDEELEAVSGGVTWVTVIAPVVGGTIKATAEAVKAADGSGNPEPADTPDTWAMKHSP